MNSQAQETATRIAIITCREMPEPDFDEEFLMSGLQDRLDASLVAWDDPSFEAGNYGLCVVRSSWNYQFAPEAFSDWIRTTNAGTTLLNPAKILLWNLHKEYLVELAERGVPIVPTALVRTRTGASIEELTREREWTDIVVKPAISGGSYRTRRFRSSEWAAAQDFLDGLLEDGDALVQRYMESVDTTGEVCLVWIDGEWTHAIRKEPRFADDEEGVTLVPTIAPKALELSKRITSLIPGWPDDLLYARVDLIEDADGELCLSELELIEPSLFLVQHPPARERLIAGIARRCR